jgi:hypothetical protein
MDLVRKGNIIFFPLQPAFKRWIGYGKALHEKYGEEGLVHWLKLFVPLQFHSFIYFNVKEKDAS